MNDKEILNNLFPNKEKFHKQLSFILIPEMADEEVWKKHYCKCIICGKKQDGTLYGILNNANALKHVCPGVCCAKFLIILDSTEPEMKEWCRNYVKNR